MSEALQKIKDEYAKELGVESYEKVLHMWEYSIGISSWMDERTFMNEICRRYATACSKATQENCLKKITELADQYPYKKRGDKESYSERRDAMNDAFDMAQNAVSDPSNIVIL